VQAAVRTSGVGKILEAAEGCFGERGYARASMADIARTAGVAKSLLHYHFDTKASMFLAVQMRTLESMLIDAKRATYESSEGRVRLRSVLNRVYDDLSRDRRKARVLLELHTWEEGPNVNELAEFHSRAKDLIVRGIQELAGEERIRSEVGLEQIADMTLLLFKGVLVELCSESDDAAGTRTKAAFTNLVVLLEQALIAPHEGRE